MSNQEFMSTITELKEMSKANIQRNCLKIKSLHRGEKDNRFKSLSQVLDECMDLEKDIKKYKIDFRKYIVAERVTLIMEAIQNKKT